MQRNFGGILRLRSISAERKRKGEKEWGKRKYDFGVNLQDSRKHQGPREAGAGSLCRMRTGGALAKPRGPAHPAGAVGARPGRGRRPYLCLHCKTPVAGAPGSSCRRRPGGATSPAAGGRTRAAGCGPRRPWRAEGRGSRTRASRRRLGSGRSPLAGRGPAGLDGTPRARSPLRPSLAAQTFLALGCGVQRRGRGARLTARRRELAGGRRASERARRGPGPGCSTAFYGCVRCGCGPSRPFIALRGGLAPPPGGGRPMPAPGALGRLPPRAPPAPPGPPPSPAFVVPSLARPGPPAAHLASHRSEPHPRSLPDRQRLVGGGHCRQTAPSGP